MQFFHPAVRFRAFDILPVTLRRVHCPTLAFELPDLCIRRIRRSKLLCWIQEFTNLNCVYLLMSETFGGRWDPLTTLFGSNGQIFAWQIIQQCKKRILNKREWFRGEINLTNYLNVFCNCFERVFILYITIYIYVYMCVCVLLFGYISCMWYNELCNECPPWTVCSTISAC